jgi:DNA-binding HxlR family transcriptional regulator
MYERKIPRKVECGITFIMEIIGGKWKPCLIYYIDQGAKRPSELQRQNPTATRRVLNQQLKELEEHGIVKRVVYAELPPKVEYSLTDMGRTLLPVIHVMYNWGEEQMEKATFSPAR